LGYSSGVDLHPGGNSRISAGSDKALIEDVQHALGAVNSDEQMLAVFRRELMLATAAVLAGP
jgi:hypothetical protein